jgi:hypothetical protein
MSNGDDADLAANVDKLRRRMATKVTEIKGAVTACVEPLDNQADSVCITNALLELALDRHVALHEADGFDLIESAYRGALKRQRGPLQ